MQCRLGALALLTFLFSINNHRAAAEGTYAELSPHRPRVCIGYNEPLRLWGWDDAPWANLNGRFCPKNYAYMSVARPGGPYARSPASVSVIGDCCPLPADDILTDQHIFSEGACDENYVATGEIMQSFFHKNNYSVIRCTKINSNRYGLAPATNGVFWGFLARAAFFFSDAKKIKRNDIPPALRAGVGRLSRWRWRTSGCIGDPPGSLLTAKLSAGCSGHTFRMLVYRGLPGDPPASTPVRMFPDCRYITDIFSPDGGCANF